MFLMRFYYFINVLSDDDDNYTREEEDDDNDQGKNDSNNSMGKNIFMHDACMYACRKEFRRKRIYLFAVGTTQETPHHTQKNLRNTIHSCHFKSS